MQSHLYKSPAESNFYLKKCNAQHEHLGPPQSCNFRKFYFMKQNYIFTTLFLPLYQSILKIVIKKYKKFINSKLPN